MNPLDDDALQPPLPPEPRQMEPQVQPETPSVLKPAVPTAEQMLREELRRLREEEVDQLREQLNQQRQASLLDLEV
jgi:hypothetical protein